MDDFLIDRRKEIEADPSLRITDRLKQRGAWYRVRPIMVADGFQPRKNWGITGESFAANIRQHCKQLGPDENITREYLGIFAKARGVFYYKGEKYPIEFDAIEELASKAAINIVIEKEGVPAVLEPYADKYGVALINSQGRLVDYVKDFVRASHERLSCCDFARAMMIRFDMIWLNRPVLLKSVDLNCYTNL